MEPLRLRTGPIAVCVLTPLFALAVGGCRLLEGDPPFQYLSACLVKGEEAGCHRLVGLHYSIRNVCRQPIIKVHACFDLFDTEGVQLPSPGGNHFDLTFDGSIGPDSTWAICTSLDASFYYQPEPELVGERFRVYRVDLADGSTWSDPLALFTYPYTLTSAGGEGVP